MAISSHINLREKKKEREKNLILQSYNSTHANTIALEVSNFHTHTNKGYLLSLLLLIIFLSFHYYPLQSPVI